MSSSPSRRVFGRSPAFIAVVALVMLAGAVAIGGFAYLFLRGAPITTSTSRPR